MVPPSIVAIDAAIKFDNELISDRKSMDTSAKSLNRERGRAMLLALLNKLTWEEMRALLYKCFLKVIDMNQKRVTRTQQQQEASSCCAGGAIATAMVAQEWRDQGGAMGQERAKRAPQQQDGNKACALRAGERRVPRSWGFTGWFRARGFRGRHNACFTTQPSCRHWIGSGPGNLHGLEGAECRFIKTTMRSGTVEAANI